MTKNPKILLLFAAFFIASCSGTSNESDSVRMIEPAGSEVCHRMNEAEALTYAPTDLFKAIYCNDQELFNEAFSSLTFRFDQKNEAEGDTPLAVAIKLNRENMVLPLISRAELAELEIKNHRGRSFVSLLAEYDMLEEFDVVVDKFRDQRSMARDILSYDFHKIDFDDDFGRNAAHYALSAAMMDRLRQNWRRSFTDIGAANPLHRFYYSYDQDENLFLHSAARDQRVYVINWYVDNYCTTNERREDESGLFGGINFFGRQARYAIQDMSVNWEITQNLGALINISNLHGDTPLHIAARLGNSESLRFLLACPQVDPSIENDQGRSPIAELLKNIDPFQEEIHESFKDSFNLLLERADPVWWSVMRGNNFRNMMAETDGEQMTAVHYAARLADPYFFNKIPDFAKQAVLNEFNTTAEELRRR